MKEKHKRLVLLRRALLEKGLEKYQILYIIKRFWLYHETMEPCRSEGRLISYVADAFVWEETFEDHNFWTKVSEIYRNFLTKNGITS